MNGVGRQLSAMQNDTYVICLAHADPRLAASGIERYLADEAALLRRRGVSMLCLFPFPTRRSRKLSEYLSGYWGLTIDGRLCGFHKAEGVGGVVAGLRRMGRRPLEIQIHHLVHVDPKQVEILLREVPVAVKLFLHDYYTVCPQYNLLRNGLAYCGSEIPSLRKCAGCASWTPAHHEKIRALLEPVKARLTVVAPSRSAMQIWLDSFPDFGGQAMVLPHLKPVGEVVNGYAGKSGREPIRLAYVGAPARHKGWDIFTKLTEELSAANLNYEFYHFGLSKTKCARIRNVPVSFLEDGDQAMTEAIRRANIDVVLLWALWPETYSYTMQESLLANAMAITNPESGNIADTVAREGCGLIFRDYDELRNYAMDVNRVENDINLHRGRAKTLPERLVANEAILEAIDFAPADSLSGEGGPVRNAVPVEALYRLKLLKAALAAKWSRGASRRARACG